jgi:hypothetical protein
MVLHINVLHFAAKMQPHYGFAVCGKKVFPENVGEVGKSVILWKLLKTKSLINSQ